MRGLFGAALIALAGCHAFYLDANGQLAQRSAEAARAPEGVRASIGAPLAPHASEIVLVKRETVQPAKEKPGSMLERLEFKESILGFKVPDLELPAFKAPPQERQEAIKKQFPPLPAIPALPAALPGPAGEPMTLADLQQIALRTNPRIQQAHQDILAARGLAVQAGLYPNPVIGYEGTTIGQGNPDGQRSPGQQGGFAEQTIVTAGKLTLARNAAQRDVHIAEQTLRQVETEVQTQVRVYYFAVLSARENYRVTQGLAELTDELYNVLLLQMQVGEVAAYEPMQIRVQAMQSRGSLVQSYNRYVAAWKQLAAAIGMPAMPLTALAGRIDMPVPHLDHDTVLAYVLANHSEVIAAEFGIDKARLLTRLAEVQPYPDVKLYAAWQKDYTTPPFGQVGNVSVGVPFPLWNRNQGNVQTARAQWQRAMQEQARVQNDLTARVAEAFQRYENNRVLLDMYKKQMLPNQVQAFRAAVARHAALGEKNVSYNDVVTVQQTLANLIASYLNVLNDQWTSVVDIANLTQTRDLFATHQVVEVEPVPEVHEIARPGLRHRR